ncbi:MAG: hypothetical protein QOJ73_3216 [Streptosporangiaceae bacterium]|nr:hypothetical protein [Streptosporangiaceae bacterium]
MSFPLGARTRSWPPSVAVAVAFAACILGGLLAYRPIVAGAALGAACFAALVMVDVSLGVALWIPALFLVPGIITSLMGLGIAAAWLGSVVSVRPSLRQVLPGQPLLVGVVVLLLGWLSLTFLWARDPHLGWVDLRGWLIAAGALIVVASTTTTPVRLRLVFLGFLLGAFLSVSIGWLTEGSSSRFAGVDGNPNDLAAHLLPVIVLAATLMADRRRTIERVALGACLSILIIALVATQSRGGFVAVGVTVVAAAGIYKRYGRYLVLAITMVVAVAGVWVAVSPGALSHVTSSVDGGAGRTTLWDVAWRMASDRAPIGVGLNNFRLVSQDYVRRPGLLRYVGQIESPHVVHNTYLQLLAETGIPGLGLFLAVILACLASARRAVRRFEHLGLHDLSRLARAVLLASISVLAAQLFQSNGYDTGLWVLLALGPALLAMTATQTLGRDSAFA